SAPTLGPKPRDPGSTSREAVLFDMDGVLVNGERARFEAYNGAAVELGLPRVTWQDFEQKYNLSVRELYHALQPATPYAVLAKAVVKRMAAAASAFWVNVDARPLLEQLRAQGFRLALVTNNYSPVVHEVLGRAGLLDFFEVAVCVDHVARPKPAPDVVTRALEELGVEAGRAVMLGDSPKDADAARAAGVYLLGLGVDGHERLEGLRDAAAWFQARFEPGSLRRHPEDQPLRDVTGRP
ncbi:MAG TPA: HAD family hydrolase, partial [Myxococcaceae bacterium]|nr:HAD family hydrolase [Myxococcaceae bacterium]